MLIFLGMNTPLWPLYVQAASWVAAAITAMIAVYRLGQDNKKAREQRAFEIAAREEANKAADRELEWRRANAAQASLEKMEEDPEAADAMLMLDWDGRKFPSEQPKWQLRKKQVLHALRPTGSFTEAELYVRDCFDHLFWHFERIQHQIQVGLITVEHVRFPLGYVAALIKEDGDRIAPFLESYGYAGTQALLQSLERIGLPALALHYEELASQDEANVAEGGFDPAQIARPAEAGPDRIEAGRVAPESHGRGVSSIPAAE